MKKNDQSGKKLSRLQIYIIISMFIFVIFGIAATAYYQKYIQPFNQTVISIDNKDISMRYFIEQIKIRNADPITMLQVITQEELIKIVAPRYGIHIADADIDKYLRKQASDFGDVVSDVEFREWYRQLINNNKISDSQYKQLISYQLIYNRLQEYFAAQVPNMMFQVHLNWIVVATEEDCDKAITRIKSGESFANVAKDISLDMATKDKGGDLGWVPPVISLDEYIINNLMVNEVSEPLAHFSQQLPDSPSQQSQEPDYWYIYMVSEKDNSRIVDSTDLLILKSNALDDWYNQEIKNHDIRYNFNTEIYTWIIDQLEEDNDYSN